MRRNIEISAFLFALLTAALAAHAWLAARADRQRLAATLAAQKQVIDSASEREHSRDASLQTALAEIEKLKRGAQSPAQIVQALPKFIPLPQPITLVPAPESDTRVDSLQTGSAQKGSAASEKETGKPVGATLSAKCNSDCSAAEAQRGQSYSSSKNRHPGTLASATPPAQPNPACSEANCSAPSSVADPETSCIDSRDSAAESSSPGGHSANARNCDNLGSGTKAGSVCSQPDSSSCTAQVPADNPECSSGNAPATACHNPNSAAQGKSKSGTSACSSANSCAAQIPAVDLKPLYDYVQDCRACQAHLAVAKQNSSDEAAKIAALTRERDAAVSASKGGSFFTRLRRNAFWFAAGTAAGFIAAKR